MPDKINFEYSTLINRNWAFVSKTDQASIKNSRILFAGCGLGSVIALAAARIGFCNFILIDGDTIELSNLNRQAFAMSSLGMNKADVTARLIKDINPDAQVKVISKYIEDTQPFHDDFLKSDIIINTVDFGKIYFDLVNLGQECGKHVILPLNIGFGSFVFIFNRDTKTLGEIMGTPIIEDDITFCKKLVSQLNIKLPDYISCNIDVLFETIKSMKSSPQIVVGAQLASAIVITSMIKIASGIKVSIAPEFIYQDLF
jgi:molybdopterin/thiamine biosynthesis adenylyltransferase